ncbi:hypothetical protein GKR73_14780 [Providencia stuartii]|nr:Tox-REase-5 domain-containing protein [Providencia stuartii]MTC82805.1 hypothetical protein [Providencia stuartii]
MKFSEEQLAKIQDIERNDYLTQVKTEFFYTYGDPWFKGAEDVIAQATRQQVALTSLQKIPFCHWHFLEPVSAKYFKTRFSIFSNLVVFHTP